MMEYKYLFNSLFEHAPCRVDRTKLESPIEEFFIDGFEKYISPQAEIYPQFEVATPSGKFRLDFFIELNNKKIGIECDGKDFHDEYKDEWRDAIILGYEKVDTIYRFRGKDLYWNTNDCIHFMFHYDNDLFNNRYQHNYPRLISGDLIEKFKLDPNYSREQNYFDYCILNEDGHQTGAAFLLIYRRTKSDKRAFWNSLFDIARNNPGLGIEELIKIKRSSNKQL